MTKLKTDEDRDVADDGIEITIPKAMLDAETACIEKLIRAQDSLRAAQRVRLLYKDIGDVRNYTKATLDEINVASTYGYALIEYAARVSEIAAIYEKTIQEKL